MSNRQEFFGKTFEELIIEGEKELQRLAEEEAKAKGKLAEELRKKQEQEAARLEELRLLRERVDSGTDITGLAVQAILKLPDFDRIHREFNSIPDLLNKIMYIDRLMYERLTEYAAGMFMDPQKSLRFHYNLAQIGLQVLCPYLNLVNPNTTTHEDCTIDEEVTMALCGGRYDICAIFKDRMMRAAQGQIKIRLPDVKVSQPFDQECLVDLRDLDDWWKGEGKYE